MLKIALALTLVAIAAGVVFFVTLIDTTKWKEFDPSKLENQAQTLIIYDKDNEPVGGMYGTQNRMSIPLTDVPDKVQKAFISAEDVRFYSHAGVDIKRIFGALWADIRKRSLSEGASTISQQLIKNTHLTNEKTWTRKLQEARLALQLEQVYTKEQILEMYLNTVYFGKGAYGIEAAANAYFGKSAKELTTAEGAMLAGVLKGPGIYAPHINLEKSTDRRNLILELMNKYGYLTEDEMKAAQKEKVKLAAKTDKKDNYGFYLDATIQEASAITKISHEDMVSGGYRIYTSMDTKLQAQCEAIMADKGNYPPNAKDGTQVQGALVVLDSKTSAVRAVVGGRDYVTRFGLNRATDSRRQPGSSIKPVLVYGPAIDRFGYTPATMLLDQKTDFNGYTPDNAGNRYRGWVTMRQALVNSLNVPAVRIVNDIGLGSAKDFASSLGIPFDKGDNNLAIALGGLTQGVTPLELAQAYGAFPNQGKYTQASFITKIVDADDNVIYQNKYPSKTVMSNATAYLVTSMMQDAATNGTARLLGGNKMPVAAKTGTVAWTKGTKDIWLGSFNPENVVVAWMGFDKTDNTHYMASNLAGGKNTAQVVKQVYSYIYKNREAPKFHMPDSVTLVALDKMALYNTQQVLLASPLTPEDQKLYEFFPKTQVPTQQTQYWQTPLTPTGFNLTLSTRGYPVVSFLVAQDFARYDVYRIDMYGATEKITEIRGAAGTVATYEDFTASAGTYRYYITPVHPDLNVTGSPTDALEITTLVPAETTPMETMTPEATATPDMMPDTTPDASLPPEGVVGP